MDLRIAAADAGYEERVQQLAKSVEARFRYHSIELPGGGILPGLQSIEHLRWRLGLFGLPEDLSGKRVLDIGAWDGWFSFECERRGASVVAVDCVELDTFLEARELIGSKVEYRTLDMNELSSARLGRFDIVLFLGVLYHLRHPLMGLEKVVELTTDLALVESFVIEREARAVPTVMEFYERGELGGQIDNWCGPSPECLMAMCRSAGFAQAELRDITNRRASVVCRRKWPEAVGGEAVGDEAVIGEAVIGEAVTGEGKGRGTAPHLHSATNNRNYTARFHPAKEEYVCCYFQSPETALTVDSVFIEIDGYGVPALTVVESVPGAYQANCIRPPGLDPGPHRVRLRTARSGLSNAVEISVLTGEGEEIASPGQELPPEAPELCSAEVQAARDRRITVNRGGTLICYFRSGAGEIGASQVEVEAAGARLAVHTISSLEAGVWQVNLMLDRPLDEGTPVRLRLGKGAWSAESHTRNL
ncbi:MAG: DUF1698 domain-containing protein [Acidobacteriota bacterium]|nr:DUF1698 domain-containing protein [Acidobacteriota bacterium]